MRWRRGNEVAMIDMYRRYLLLQPYIETLRRDFEANISSCPVSLRKKRTAVWLCTMLKSQEGAIPTLPRKPESIQADVASGWIEEIQEKGRCGDPIGVVFAHDSGSIESHPDGVILRRRRELLEGRKTAIQKPREEVSARVIAASSRFLPMTSRLELPTSPVPYKLTL